MKKIVIVIAVLIFTVVSFVGGALLSTYVTSREASATNSASAQPAPATSGGSSRVVVPANVSQSAPLSGADLARAQRLFNSNCASCHMASGKGEEHHRKDNIPDFTDPAWHARRSDPEIVASVANGRGSIMPSFKQKLSPAEIRLLVDYIHGFPERAAHGRAASTNTPADDGAHHHH